MNPSASDHLGAVDDCRCFASDQNRDTPVLFREFRNVYLRHIYARAYDTRIGGDKGQDYLYWRYTEDALLFAICDGVSGSFYGNIAAERLATYLVDELLLATGVALAEEPQGGAREDILKTHLNAFSCRASHQVDEAELPAHCPALQREALLQLRNEYGSETVFVCGRLAFGDEARAQLASLLLIWMGDAEAQVYDDHGHQLELGGEWRSVDRWSTKLGVRGKVYSWVSPADGPVSRVMAFSDGLADVADRIARLTRRRNPASSRRSPPFAEER